VFSNVLGLVSINLPNGRIAALYSSASTSPSSAYLVERRSYSAAGATSWTTQAPLPPCSRAPSRRDQFFCLNRAATEREPRTLSGKSRARAAPSPGPNADYRTYRTTI